jgi:hypothetical protein
MEQPPSLKVMVAAVVAATLNGDVTMMKILVSGHGVV